MSASRPEDFAADVLARLERRRVTFRGCLPAGLTLALDGGVAVWFAGDHDGRPWRGAVRFSAPFAADRLHLADPETVAAICAQLIERGKGG